MTQNHFTPAMGKMEADLLLDLLGQTPIVFHRCYVDITGSVTAALWLSHAIYHITENATEEDSWFSKSQSAWEQETGLSRREQETARKLLVRLDILKERRPGLQRPMQFQIDFDILMQRLQAQSEIGSRQFTASPHATNTGLLCG